MTSEKKPPQIVSCDSQVLMWAFPWVMRAEHKKKKTPQDVPEMRRRAKLLMKALEENGSQICIPSVVVAELLAGIDPAKHARVLAEFTLRFFCPSFDTQACILAAKLWQYERGLKGVSPGLPQDERSARNILKADMLIVASAKFAGATIFYSHEEKCRRLASQAGMQALDLPTHSEDLFVDLEVRKEVEQETMDENA